MTDIKRLVAFAILMEAHEGILGKAPYYVYEKFSLTQHLEDPSQALDSNNKAKYEEYLKRWKV